MLTREEKNKAIDNIARPKEDQYLYDLHMFFFYMIH